MRRRRKERAEAEAAVSQESADGHTAPDGATADAPEPARAGAPGRPDGPWDRSEKEPSDRHIDLGSLLVRGRIGIELRVPKEGDGPAAAVVLMTEDAGLELRAFAAPRSGGMWDGVREEMILEVERLEGSQQVVDGVYGPELHVRLPAKTPDGQPGVQPTRIVAIEGPRWMLRATFMGRAALEPSDEGILADSLRDVIVVRGPEPRTAREALPIVVRQQQQSDAAEA